MPRMSRPPSPARPPPPEVHHVRLTDGYKNKMLEGTQWLHENREFTDFTIKTHDGEIQCHKHILSAQSPVIKAMLEVRDIVYINTFCLLKPGDQGYAGGKGHCLYRYVLSAQNPVMKALLEVRDIVSLGMKFVVSWESGVPCYDVLHCIVSGLTFYHIALYMTEYQE